MPDVEYEVTAVARTQASSGAPTFTEIGRIAASGLSYEHRLNRPGQSDIGASRDAMPSEVIERFEDLVATPTEIWVRRNDKLVARGPIGPAGVQGETGTINILAAASPIGYIDYMREIPATDITFNQDQHFIVRDLIDRWQDESYGHFGLDTSAITASGVTRQRTYAAFEPHPWLQRIIELAEVSDGFDFHATLGDIDTLPAVVLTSPARGTDRSATVTLERGVVTPGLHLSVAAGTIASHAFGVGSSLEADPIRSVQIDTDVLESFGRAGLTELFDGVSVQGTLDGHTQALLDAHSRMLLVPGPGLVPVAEADVDSFDVGDTVMFVGDFGFQVAAALRVTAKRVTVSEENAESISVEFG